MVLLLVLLPVTAYSQMGLYELQQGKMAVGFAFTGLDFSIRQEIMGIGGNLSYGINNPSCYLYPNSCFILVAITNKSTFNSKPAADTA